MFYLNQRTILRNLILLTVIWVVVTFNYYLIGLQVKYLPGNFENNMLAMVGSDIPASLFGGYLVRKGFAAKRLYMCYMLTSAMASLSMVLFVEIDNSGIEMPILAALSRMGCCATFMTLYLTHPDMFPTLFAATSIGIANFVCRTCVIPAPLIAEIEFPRPMILFTVLGVIATFSAAFIIEDKEEIKKTELVLAKQLSVNES
jgi:hypothetical protein